MGLLKVDFINQRFFIKSFLIYILVSVLFLNHYSNKNLLIKDKLQLIFRAFAFKNFDKLPKRLIFSG